jgi:phosphohistidine phosphatase
VRPFLGDVETRIEPRLYEATAGRLLEVVRDADAEARALLMIGHNPGFEDLARRLTGHGDRYAFARLTEKYPTAGLAVIDFSLESWAQIEPRAGRLERFVTPKTLGADADD